MSPPEAPIQPAREGIARAFALVEDVVYVGLGLLLAGIVIILLPSCFITFARSAMAWSVSASIIGLLDRILLILLIVELLYTVQVSFRAHALIPEPFLLVGLISGIRRVLVVTAEVGERHQQTEGESRFFVVELAVLAGLILALAVSLMLLRKKGAAIAIERA